MNILHINTSNAGGGAEQFSTDLMMYTENAQMIVKQIKISGPRFFALESNFIDKIISILDKILWKMGLKKPLRTIFFFQDEWHSTYTKLKKNKQFQNADIIHLHNIHGSYFDLEALIKIAKEKKIVWTLHDMWCMTGGEAHTFENSNYKKGIGQSPYISLPPLYSPLIDRRQHFIEKKKEIYSVISNNITFVPVCKWLNQCFISSYTYNSKFTVKTVYNGYDNQIFYDKKKRNWKLAQILFFNTSNKFKASELFLNVISSITFNFKLLNVGIPISNSKIEIINNDFINKRETLSEIYNDSDIMIFTSKAECFPLTVMEAMACGVCVIASDVGGIHEIINDGVNGFLFNNSNPKELIDKINFLLSDLDFTREIGRKAANDVAEKYTISICSQNYNKVYEEILNK